MRVHTTALTAFLRTIPALTAKTFVTRIPYGTAAPNPPYVIVYPSDGTDTVERLAGPAATQWPRFTLHTVGLSYDQCAAVADLIKGTLIVNGFGVRLDVPGERSGMLWWESPIPIQADTDVTPPLIWHTAEVGWESNPA